MKKSYSALFVKSAIALALAAPMLASAESQLVTTNTATTGAQARLNFSIQIPKVLMLRVGAVGAGNINTLTYDYAGTPADVGTGTDSVAQSLMVSVLGNNGQVTLGAAGTAGGLSNGTDSIPWTEIVATSDDNANLAVPAVGNTTSPMLNTTKVTNRTTSWNFAYSNTNVVAPGTYAGQITYTATMP